MSKTTKKNETALVLRTCDENLRSHGGFQWPGVGETAEAPDWIANEECGNGLHGWLYGQGVHGVSQYTDETAKWIVVEVELASIIMLGGKCKFPRCVVRFVGDKKAATDYLLANEPRSATVAVIGATICNGDGESALVGVLGTATAGDGGTATAGDGGTATAGYSGEIRIRYWDAKAGRYRTKVGYIGEDGLEPNVAYRLDDKHEFIAA